MDWQYILFGGLSFALLLGFLIKLSQRPLSRRDWAIDQAVMPTATFEKDGRITVKNIRNIDYRTTKDFDVNYFDRTFYLSEVVTGWLGIEPFGSTGAAHIFTSFGLADGTYIAVSAEIRREKGETYDPLKGLLGYYELTYILADEKDLINLRANNRESTIRLYPIKATEEQIQTVFFDILKRANKLAREPELYDTITNNCIVNMVRHIRKLNPDRLPSWDYRYLFGTYVDKLAYDKGLIDTDLPLEEARKAFTVNERAKAHKDSAFFSHEIRKSGTFPIG